MGTGPARTEAEIKLSQALAAFERATEEFKKCRCFTYHQMVIITTDALLKASDAVFLEQRKREGKE